jgi:alkylhydroperoxidase family enzyme
MTAPRITPVTEITSELEEIFAVGNVRRPDGGTLNIIATIGQHPKLLKRWYVFSGHIMTRNTLSDREREIAILRVGVRCNSVYEFSQHAQIALRCGMTADEVQAVKSSIDSGPWSAHEKSILRAVDELHDDNKISDSTWASLAQTYNEQQLLDLIFTVGQYHLVSMMLNSCQVELDAGVPNALD